MGKKEVKKVVKDFDVWVTRDHNSDLNPCYDRTDDNIEISDAYETEVTCTRGCCLFARDTNNGYGRRILLATCRRRYDFLPRPGECWNVWSVDGVLHHQEWPLTLSDTNKLYPKIEHESEKKYYI